MNAYRRVEAQLHSFLSSALNGGKWSLDVGKKFPYVCARLRGQQNQCGLLEERKYVLLLAEFKSRAAQFVE
jgi:hypothetical protein